MRVQLVREYGTADGKLYQYGDVIDVSDETAAKLIRYGFGVEASAPLPPEPEKHTITTASFAPPEENAAKRTGKAKPRPRKEA